MELRNLTPDFQDINWPAGAFARKSPCALTHTQTMHGSGVRAGGSEE